MAGRRHVNGRKLGFFLWSGNGMGREVSVRGLAGKLFIFLYDAIRFVADKFKNLPWEVLGNTTPSR